MLRCRSILPENLHFDKDLNIKLTHFASAVDLGAGPLPNGPQSLSVVDYLAPEVCLTLHCPKGRVTSNSQNHHAQICLPPFLQCKLSM